MVSPVRLLLSSQMVAVIMLSMTLAACQAPDPEKPRVRTTQLQGSLPSSSASIQPTSSATQKGSDDVVGKLIDEIEAKENKRTTTEPTSKPNTPPSSVTTAQEAELFITPSIQPGQAETANLRATQALDAALDLLKSKTEQPLSQPLPFSFQAKTAEQIRVGLLLPLSGSYRQLGQHIAGGAELALFQTSSDHIELVYFDTAGGIAAEQAARQAVAADVDIVLGPLFTDAVRQARPILSGANIPVLSLSNNMTAAAPGNWVMGYLPEQQLDNLLGYVVGQSKRKIAIISSTDRFGQKLKIHAEKRLAELGLFSQNVLVLDQQTLADEDNLKAALREFSGYVKPDEEQTELPPARYDAVILAGNAEFILRTAPVLDFYDLGPSRTTFIGTDLWARTDLITEPSLQGSVISKVATLDNDAFSVLWSDYFDEAPGTLSRLGFDSLAVVIVTSRETGTEQPIDWRYSLLREEGFSGFSGTFKLLPDGRNQRDFTLYRIEEGRLNPF